MGLHFLEEKPVCGTPLYILNMLADLHCLFLNENFLKPEEGLHPVSLVSVAPIQSVYQAGNKYNDND